MRFEDLCLHPKDREALISYTTAAGVGLLLVADRGFGKQTIATSLARRATEGKDYLVKSISSVDTPSITIEQIRELKHFFTLKTSSTSESRVALILDADMMTLEAQNALLKLLEEPPERCYLLLTSCRPDRLLPTILSRVHSHTLTSPAESDLYMYLKKNGLDTTASKLAGGLVGLSVSIARGESNELVASVQQVKELLSADTFSRLKKVDQLTKDKAGLETMLHAFKLVSVGALNSTIASNKPTKKWEQLSRLVLEAEKRLNQNVSPKLILTDLMLKI